MKSGILEVLFYAVGFLVARALTWPLRKLGYTRWVWDYEHAEVDSDGEPEYSWDVGIPP